jgi:4-amino-4-deoxy-L-arabinose transferase-like glycosyltransferase
MRLTRLPIMVKVAALVLALLTVLRAYAAFNVPLTADEAYYWTWSLHPAFGYTDHPPMVAWLIWLGQLFGSGPGFVRLPFVLCEAIAAIAVGRAATLVAGNARAGAIATILFALIPQTKLALGEALPDGAYMAAWSLALWAAAALDRRPVLRIALGLGLAVGAVVLSRTFGWALAAGILAWSLEPVRRRRLWPLLASAVALVLVAYAPFIAWNMAHDWENFAFTFHTRQHFGYSGAHPLDISTVRFMIYALLLAALTWFVALRREPRVTLVAWTALPLAAVLFGFSFVTTTESYWIIGPAASVALAAGIVLERSAIVWRRIVIALLGVGTAYATLAALFLALPEGTQARVFFAFPALRGPLASGVYVFAPLAASVSAQAAADHDAVILTDRYETAAELRWYGVDSRIVVALPQQPQWTRWHAGLPVPQHALLVTFAAPMSFDPTLARDVTAAFGHVAPLSNVTLSYAGKRQDVYYMVQLDDPHPNARALIPGL